MCGVYDALVFPMSALAAALATRPSVMPPASMMISFVFIGLFDELDSGEFRYALPYAAELHDTGIAACSRGETRSEGLVELADCGRLRAEPGFDEPSGLQGVRLARCDEALHVRSELFRLGERRRDALLDDQGLSETAQERSALSRGASEYSFLRVVPHNVTEPYSIASEGSNPGSRERA